jgi:hypothetical protein
MTTLREAAQQALEALEGVFEGDEKGAQYWTVTGGTYEAVYCKHAITALKAALEQPEQKPVAWMFQHEETGRMNYVSNDGYNATGRFLEMNPRYALVCALYTHPPRREWRGLTDTERAAVQHESFKRGLSPLEFMELHEAKLKEKNHE